MAKKGLGRGLDHLMGQNILEENNDKVELLGFGFDNGLRIYLGYKI